MSETVIRFADIEWILTIIVLVAGVIRIIKEVKKPNDDLRKQVEKHERYLEQDKQYLDEVSERNKVLYKSLLALIEHDIDGNSIDKLKKIRDELQTYVIEE